MFCKKCVWIFITVLLTLLISCSGEKIERRGVIVGIASDIESVNPLFAFSQEEVKISELLYLSLVKFDWNEEKGEPEAIPMLAKSWEWSNDSLSLTLYLRDDIIWSDSTPFTSADVIYSFDLYSDPVINSRLFAAFNSFYTHSDLRINYDSTFNNVENYKLTIRFKQESIPSLYSIDFPILPKHIYEKKNRRDLFSSDRGTSEVSNGPFLLDKWERNTAISLKRNETYSDWGDQAPEYITFKIIPDYNSRLIQLRNGEIDMAEDIKPADAEELKKINHLIVGYIEGREYDYVGWNNIAPSDYAKGIIKPHPLFGSPEVRRALTLAINREEIKEETLGDFGEVASGPISPIFRNIYNNKIDEYQFDPKQAKEILTAEGWIDTDKDGVIEKGGKAFRFMLHLPSGNPRRSFAATIIKNNLKAVGIETITVETEPAIFFDNMFQKNYDAWIAGWSVPIPPDPKIYFHSNLQENQLNVMGFRSKEADQLFNQLSISRNKDERNNIYKEIQKVLHTEQPVTFLYWINNPVVYHKRILNVKITPLGPLHFSDNWSIE
jgi:peptide/nickel transport system substrate-binding protein